MFCTHASTWYGARCDRAPRSSRRPNLVQMNKSSCGPHAGPRSSHTVPLSSLTLLKILQNHRECSPLSPVPLLVCDVAEKWHQRRLDRNVFGRLDSLGHLWLGHRGRRRRFLFGVTHPLGKSEAVAWYSASTSVRWGLPDGPDLRRSVMGKPMAGRPRAQAGVMAAKAVRMVRLIQSMFLQP